ncbi:N-6 DNA methylase [Chryseobacterium lactis]|uniref:N-6 DNA methylase n=1 Tax=Chryseobacterium lactis TaxID=1241981 RepID=A0A3G6RMI5_CHRLC|nr:N-6 DNA methylase [Chryseobacterium lactis]AZA82368.1 N-6 DNA methylase [Chryseobacterium lactis]AZB02750.1 N-6 DNA methylase [Chryseobacterium lactis]PNW13956.1 N-6 DNA methylase [Chryseobacterium lactis]
MVVEIKGNKIKAPLKGNNVWIPTSPEEEIRQKYICRLVNVYGFTTKQMVQDYDYSQITDKKVKSDILVWKNEMSLKNNEKPLIFIECKSDSIIIRPEDYFKGIEISKQIGAEFFVATNSKQTKIYSKVFKITEKGHPNELINIPTNEQAQDDHIVSVLLGQTNEFARDEFSKTLTRCHNIIRNNDKLSPEAAFDEISKVLFVKTIYERSNTEGNIFSIKTYLDLKQNFVDLPVNRNLPFYQELFEKVKRELIDDDLFEPSEIIRIRENSFEAIVKELEIYNLSTTSDDVKGIAFEQFLGKTFRGELGQFFTPRTIVDFMVEVLDPQESEVICDPCCGSGGFLIKAFEYVRAKIENEIHLVKEKTKEQYYDEKFEKLTEKKKAEIDEKVNELFIKLNSELDINNPKSRIRVLSYDCIFGTDANPRMSRTAKMNMIMHGDGHGGVHHNDGLLNVNGIFENRFDVILTNPPFGSRVEKSLKITEADKYTDTKRIAKYRERYGEEYEAALKQINENIDKPLLDLYDTGSMSTLTEVLFIERCLNLLKPGGRMGIVLPEGVLNNTNLQKIRDYVESRAKILLIVSIPQDVFIASGATVKPSLVFFKKFTKDEAEQYRKIIKKTEKEIKEKYESETKPILAELGVKGKEALKAEEKKKLRTELKKISENITVEIKAQVKKEFNYEIPIAEIEKAGISTTGGLIENELKPLATEFKTYKEQKRLWINNKKEVKYEITDGDIHRLSIIDGNVSEPELFYVKAKD